MSGSALRRRRPRPDGVEPVPPSRRRAPTDFTSSDSTDEGLHEAVLSASDVAVATFAHSSPLAVPPLWPMMMAATEQGRSMTLEHFRKMLERFGGRMTEIDLTMTDDVTAQSIFDMISADSTGACAAVRVLRCGSANLELPHVPSLQELYGCPVEILSPSCKLRVLACPCSNITPSPLLCEAASPRPLEVAAVTAREPSSLVALLNGSPRLTQLRLKSLMYGGDGVFQDLASHPVATTLRHLIIVGDELGQASLLSRFPCVETYSFTACLSNLNEVVSSLPGLRHLRVFNVTSRYGVADLSFLSRVVTLQLQVRDDTPTLFDSVDWGTLPNVMALRHLSIDFGTQSAAVATRLVHPLLKTFDVTSRGKVSLLSQVFDALKRHRPPLSVLGLFGCCPELAPTVAEVLSSCGAELRKLNLHVWFSGAARVCAADGWEAVAEHCPRLLQFYGNLLCDPAGSRVVQAVRHVRGLELVACHVSSPLTPAACDRWVSLTARRNLTLLAVKCGRGQAAAFCARGGGAIRWYEVSPWRAINWC